MEGQKSLKFKSAFIKNPNRLFQCVHLNEQSDIREKFRDGNKYPDTES